MEISSRSVGGVTVLELTGRLTAGPDGLEDEALRGMVCDLLNSGRLQVVMNLSGLTHIDAHGLGELAMVMNTVQVAGGRLMLMAASPRVAAMLAVTRLNTAFEWCDTDAVEFDD
jgi:anti-sigma B factor antagonist